jgi:hypothetical protein
MQNGMSVNIIGNMSVCVCVPQDLVMRDTMRNEARISVIPELIELMMGSRHDVPMPRCGLC